MSCKQILPSTIVKCFSKYGFLFGDCKIREAGERNTEITEVGHLIQNIYGSAICSTISTNLHLH